jgi:hypothetical protein
VEGHEDRDAGPSPRRDTRVVQRLGFGFDIIDYSSRSTPQQAQLQQRLAGMAERVLQAIGLQLLDTDHQNAGDGMVVVLPPQLEVHRVLPGLLRGWRTQVVADNCAHPDDRIRLRLSVAAGPFTNAALGFTGATVIEIGRLLDSAALRQAAADDPNAEVVALISDRLYADVVGEGYPGLDPDQFVRIRVEFKTYTKEAWLWTGAALPPRSPAHGPRVGKSRTAATMSWARRLRAGSMHVTTALRLRRIVGVATVSVVAVGLLLGLLRDSDRSSGNGSTNPQAPALAITRPAEGTLSEQWQRVYVNRVSTVGRRVVVMVRDHSTLGVGRWYFVACSPVGQASECGGVSFGDVNPGGTYELAAIVVGEDQFQDLTNPQGPTFHGKPADLKPIEYTRSYLYRR